MRRLFFLTVLIIAVIQPGLAQLSEGGKPLGLQQINLKSSQTIRNYKAPKLRIEKLLREDVAANKPMRYSIYKEVDLDIKENGTLIELKDGKLWQYQIESENGFSIGLIFSRYHLPQGAKLFIYNTDFGLIYGAFTHRNNKTHNSLTIADYPAQKIIIEYFEPLDAEFSGELVLGKIGQSYRDPQQNIYNSEALGESADKLIDINCPQGDKYQLQKHAVAKMTFEEEGSGYICSGGLLNTTKNDGTPYFLTAHHCIKTDQVANTLVSYFNFEKDDCDGISMTGKTISGSALKATNSATDFTLLLLEETPPPSFRPYYAGWNAESDSTVESGFGIHHPQGKEKKISIEQNQIFSHPFEIGWIDNVVTAPNTHWQVEFDEGQTEGGSSGSPLFDENNRVIGQLHGGDDQIKLYGKLSRSWKSGSFSFQRLQPYLDPNKTGILVLDGYSPADNPVESNPYADYLTVCTNEAVQLKDGSLFGSESFFWSFSPQSVEFLQGTNAESQNPIVAFLEDGFYDVSLMVSKNGLTDTRTKKTYLSSGDSLVLKIDLLPSPVFCSDEFVSYKFIGKGSDSLEWFVLEGAKYMLIDSTSLKSDTLVLFANDTLSVDSSFAIKIMLVGYHGHCSDTAYMSQKVDVAFNDLIKNAHPILQGLNGPFTNNCATTEENEPNPVGGHCNSQIRWCDCENSAIILDNSVWFTFKGPATGIAGINAPGFDNQIAVYDANNPEDILSGDPTKYKLLAANDDYFGEEKDYSALIEGVKVTPGKKYWLQVDGSGCGTSGSFYIALYDEAISDTTTGVFDRKAIASQFEIFPNPAKDFLSLRLPEGLEGSAQLSLWSLDGKQLLLENIDNENETIQLQLPSNLVNGLYIVRLYTNKGVYSSPLALVR